MESTSTFWKRALFGKVRNVRCWCIKLLTNIVVINVYIIRHYALDGLEGRDMVSIPLVQSKPFHLTHQTLLKNTQHIYFRKWQKYIDKLIFALQ